MIPSKTIKVRDIHGGFNAIDRIRTFNGKIYREKDTAESKPEAERYALMLRKMGYSIRIIKSRFYDASGKHSQTGYVIFGRKE